MNCVDFAETLRSHTCLTKGAVRLFMGTCICVDLVENALFKILETFADHQVLCLLRFLMTSRWIKRQRSLHFKKCAGIAIVLVLNSIDSSLVTVGYQQHFLPLCVLNLMIWHIHVVIRNCVQAICNILFLM
jgi:hypothetical protein